MKKADLNKLKIITKQAQAQKKQEPFDIIDETSLESFPASDPPGWISRKHKVKKGKIPINRLYISSKQT